MAVGQIQTEDDLRAFVLQQVRGSDLGRLVRQLQGPRAAIGAFSVYRNAAVSLAAGAQVPFDTIEYDSHSWFSVGTGRFTPLVAGVYSFSTVVGGNPAADVYVQAAIRKNGATSKFGALTYDRGAGVYSSAVARFAMDGATDFVDVIWDQSSGGSLAVLVGAAVCYLQGEFVGHL